MAGAIWPRGSDLSEIEVTQTDFSQPWDLSDIAFIMDTGQRIYASKTIMAMWSPVMKVMFFSDFKEKRMPEIKLPGKSHEEILELVKVMHPPNKEIDANNIAVVLPLAREYQMDELTKRCESFLMNRAPSVLSLVMAVEFSLPELQQKCMEYIRRSRLVDLAQETAFEELTNDTKVQILLEKSMRYEHTLNEIVYIAEGRKPEQMRFRTGGTLCTFMCPDKEQRKCNKMPHNSGSERACKSCALGMMKRIWEKLQELERYVQDD